MGLTSTSTGAGAADTALVLRRERPDDRIVALAGNPNVGKSTVFNALTGLRQHTGNWPGKTVTSAQGRCERGGRGYVLVDLPGTYSLMAHRGGGGQGLPLLRRRGRGGGGVRRHLPGAQPESGTPDPGAPAPHRGVRQPPGRGGAQGCPGGAGGAVPPSGGARGGRRRRPGGRAGGADGGGRGGDLPLFRCATRPRWSLPWPPFGPCWSPA